jgi:hypothetical protein
LQPYAKQTKFYFIPKERVANLLDFPSDYIEDTIRVKLDLYSILTLSDYLIAENIVSTPSMSAYVGKVGTRADLVIGYSEYAAKDFREAKEKRDRALKQYEL